MIIQLVKVQRGKTVHNQACLGSFYFITVDVPHFLAPFEMLVYKESLHRYFTLHSLWRKFIVTAVTLLHESVFVAE